MKTWNIVFAVVAMMAIATTTYAQRCACCGGSGPANYNASAETTLSGTIDEVRTNAPSGAPMGGVHLIVSTPAGLTDVHVGPTWYVSSKNVAFVKGDALTIVGAKATMAGEEVVIAREIVKGGQTLTLRDAHGFPLWSGPRRGR